MTTLALDYKNFDDYLARLLSANSRATVRRKLRVAARAEPPIRMDVVVDATCRNRRPDLPALRKGLRALVAASSRSSPRNSSASIGRRMPDKTRFLVWRQGERIIAFALCDGA